MKVLLAEDDPQIGGAVLRAFERAGLAMQWVTRGDEADVLLAGGGAFDAAVLDIGLPGRDGIDVLRRLRGRALAAAARADARRAKAKAASAAAQSSDDEDGVSGQLLA